MTFRSTAITVRGQNSASDEILQRSRVREAFAVSPPPIRRSSTRAHIWANQVRDERLAVVDLDGANRGGPSWAARLGDLRLPALSGAHDGPSLETQRNSGSRPGTLLDSPSRRKL